MNVKVIEVPSRCFTGAFLYNVYMNVLQSLATALYKACSTVAPRALHLQEVQALQALLHSLHFGSHTEIQTGSHRMGC